MYRRSSRLGLVYGDVGDEVGAMDGVASAPSADDEASAGRMAARRAASSPSSERLIIQKHVKSMQPTERDEVKESCKSCRGRQSG